MIIQPYLSSQPEYHPYHNLSSYPALCLFLYYYIFIYSYAVLVEFKCHEVRAMANFVQTFISGSWRLTQVDVQ